MADQEWAPTRAELMEEIEEKALDLKAFCEARNLVRTRVVEVKDSKSTLTPLANWAGTDAVLGSLDLSIHAMERTLDELHAMLRATPHTLTLVRGGNDGSES
jgi:hypothetical protein